MCISKYFNDKHASLILYESVFQSHLEYVTLFGIGTGCINVQSCEGSPEEILMSVLEVFEVR